MQWMLVSLRYLGCQVCTFSNVIPLVYFYCCSYCSAQFYYDWMSLGDSKSVILSKSQYSKCFKRLYVLEKWLWELMAFLILAVFASFIPLTLKVFIFHERDYTCYLGDLRSLILLALEQLFSWGKLVKTHSVCGLHEWAGTLGPVFDSDSCSLCFSGKKNIYIIYF